MTYKTILAYVPSADHVKRLMPVIEKAAKLHDAHVTGFHVMPAIRMYSGAEVPIPAEVYDRQYDIFRQQASETGAAFAKAADGAGLRSDWRCRDAFEPDVGQALARAACTADLVIMEQDVPDPIDFGWDLASTAVIEGGRPVLVVPASGAAPKKFARRIIVAWNGSREAARATFDALPLLQRAEAVTLLSVNPSSSDQAGRFAPGEDLAIALDRHGIRAEVSVVTGGSTTDELMAQVQANDADLLVMGCYGHSRLREAVIGGATRNVLEAMSVPVLMSH